jgi:hypothetical protein
LALIVYPIDRLQIDSYIGYSDFLRLQLWVAIRLQIQWWLICFGFVQLVSVPYKVLLTI